MSLNGEGGARKFLVPACLALALAGTTFWGWTYLNDQRDAAGSSALEAFEVRDLARRIEQMRGTVSADSPPDARNNAPTIVPIAPDDPPDPSDPSVPPVAAMVAAPAAMSQRITAAEAAAGLSDDSVERTDHQGARRAENAAWFEQATGISLRGVTLGQVITFLYALEDQHPPEAAPARAARPARVSVERVRLLASEGDEPGVRRASNTWSAEATVVTVVPDPNAKTHSADSIR